MYFIVKHTNDFEIQTQSQNFPDIMVDSANCKGKYRQVITLDGVFVHFLAILQDIWPNSKTQGHLHTWHPTLSVINLSRDIFSIDASLYPILPF